MMIRRLFSPTTFSALGLCALLMGCGPATSEAVAPPSEPTDDSNGFRVATDNPPARDTTPTSEPRELPELEIIEQGKVVPAFDVKTVDGTQLLSTDLVGKKPFVMVFFASWCKVCELKLPMLKQAIAATNPDILVIGVALDHSETWDQVAPYVARHELEGIQLVRGQRHQRFTAAYNPFGSVPVVEIVHRNGIITELQRGYRKADGDKLLAALAHVNGT